MEPSASSIRARVYALVASAGKKGMTCDEVEQQTGYRHQTASARMRELVLQGRLVKRGTRATRSGRQANIHLTPSDSLTAQQVRTLRQQRADGAPLAILARHYGLPRNAIIDIIG